MADNSHNTKVSDKIYFAHVPLWHSIAVKLFFSLLGLAIFSVLASFFLFNHAYLAQVIEGFSHTGSVPITTIFFEQLFIILVFIIVPSILIAYALSSYIGQPIRKIFFGVSRIAAGDLSTDIQTKRQDELGSLTRLLNHMVAQLRDIHARHEEVASLRSKFIAVAAHQLRTPTTAVKWALDLLLKGEGGGLSEAQKKIVDRGYQANDDLTRIINDMLVASEIEEGKFVYSPKEVVLTPFIMEVIDEFSVGAERNNTRIVFKNSSEENLRSIFDPVKIKMVLGNLFMNAIQYNRQGAPIYCTLKNNPGTFTITVKDSGIGIPAKDQDKIFTRFFRASNALSVQPNGSGIGLYINKNIIERHDGKIWLVSEEGKGTTFFIQLPLHGDAVSKEANMEKFMEAI